MSIAKTPPECELKRASSTALVVAVVLTVASCIEGEGGTGVPTPRTITLRVEAGYAVSPVAATLASIDSATVRLYDAVSDTLLHSYSFTKGDFAPLTPAFFSTLELLDGESLQVRLETYLHHGEDVAFSGQEVGTIPATGGSASIAVFMGRGPPANQLLTGIHITSGDSAYVQEGATRHITFDTLGAAPGQKIFFESTDPSVAAVDSVGKVFAVTPGRALLIASGGRVADTLSLAVDGVPPLDEAIVRSVLMPQFDYVTDDRFLGTLSDQPAGQAMGGAYRALVNEMMAGRGSGAVGRFEAAERLWTAYGIASGVRGADGPQVGALALTLMYVADVLGIDFLPGSEP
jgi:hypothetical protein